MAEKIDFFEPGITNMSQTRRQQHWGAQTFTASKAYDITAVEFRVKKAGSPGPLYIEIQGVDGDHKPDGNILMSGSLAEGSIPDAQDWTGEIALSGASPGLSEGIEYAIVINAKDSPGAGNDLEVYGRQTSDMYPNGNIVLSSDWGVTWTVYVQDFWFRTYGTEVAVSFSGNPSEVLVKNALI